MRAQILAVVFIGLLAGAQCQTIPLFQCITDAGALANTLKAVDFKDMNTIFMNLPAVLPKINALVASCGPLLESVKQSLNLKAVAPVNHTQKLGLDLNCIVALNSAIQKIKQLKGSYSGGLNPLTVVTDLISLGQDATALKTACKLK